MPRQFGHGLPFPLTLPVSSILVPARMATETFYKVVDTISVPVKTIVDKVETKSLLRDDLLSRQI